MGELRAGDNTGGGDSRAGGDTGGDVAAVDGAVTDATWPLPEGYSVLSRVEVVDIRKMPWAGALETGLAGSSPARRMNWSSCLSSRSLWNSRKSVIRSYWWHRKPWVMSHASTFLYEGGGVEGSGGGAVA